MPDVGDARLLTDPVAQTLLAAPVPARLGYRWRDGTPRVVPIWFHWTGEEIVMMSFPLSPKAAVLHDGDPVALAIDTTDWPYKSLTVRGPARVAELDHLAPEYVEAARRYLGEEQGAAWVGQFPDGTPSVRIAVRPEWVCVIDFETRFPSAVSS